MCKHSSVRIFGFAFAASSAATFVMLGMGGGPEVVGPDVIYSNIPSVATFGPVNGIRAYALGTDTCNIGTQDLEWVNNGSPGLAMNAYRLYDHRLMQVGLGWVKTACCVGNGPGCGMTCQSGAASTLHVGCKDTYSAGWNSTQSRLSPRSGINPSTGAFGVIPSGSGDVIWRRLQIHETDLNPNNFPNALYFVEGQYIAHGDAVAGTWENNATYQRATFTNYQLALADTVNQQKPGIYAWRNYGNGIGQPDSEVQYVVADVAGDGRFIAGFKAHDNGNGTWRYDYAIYNYNSDRGGASFSVPIPPGAVLSNVGFHDVDYHSGEAFDNTDWNAAGQPAAIGWTSPQTFAQNSNTNALRWGTMYNFWFDASRGGMMRAELGLFRPGTPDTLTLNITGPVSLCAADIAPAAGNNAVDVDDLLLIINSWGPCPIGVTGCPADVTLDGQVDIDDLLTMINKWGPCP